MSDFNENIGTEMENGEGLSKEDLAGAGLLGLAMIVGVGAYEGGKKGIQKLGNFLDEKGKNPVTNIKKKRMEAKLNKEADKLARQKAREEILAEAAAKAAEEPEK